MTASKREGLIVRIQVKDEVQVALSYLRDVFRLNADTRDFRLFGPDETASNQRLQPRLPQGPLPRARLPQLVSRGAEGDRVAQLIVHHHQLEDARAPAVPRVVAAIAASAVVKLLARHVRAPEVQLSASPRSACPASRTKSSCGCRPT